MQNRDGRGEVGRCGCVKDGFADLPPELRPRERKESGLRQVTCPGCGLVYSTNRSGDVCMACEALGKSIPKTTTAEEVKVEIKILGTGCPKCQRLEQLTRAAAAEAGVEATFTKVKDLDAIMAYDILGTPGLVINEKVASSGRLPRKEEIVEWLRAAS